MERTLRKVGFNPKGVNVVNEDATFGQAARLLQILKEEKPTNQQMQGLVHEEPKLLKELIRNGEHLKYVDHNAFRQVVSTKSAISRHISRNLIELRAVPVDLNETMANASLLNWHGNWEERWARGISFDASGDEGCVTMQNISLFCLNLSYDSATESPFQDKDVKEAFEVANIFPLDMEQLMAIKKKTEYRKQLWHYGIDRIVAFGDQSLKQEANGDMFFPYLVTRTDHVGGIRMRKKGLDWPTGEWWFVATFMR